MATTNPIATSELSTEKKTRIMPDTGEPAMILDTDKCKVRYASITDLDAMKVAYFNILKFLDGQNFDILPTEENANWVVDNIFAPAIMDGRSEMLVVEDEGGVPISYLFWIIDQPIVKMRHKVVTSYGQWVEPDRRGNQLVGKMVGVAKDNLKKANVHHVFDMCHTPECVPVVLSYGFKINKKIVILEV